MLGYEPFLSRRWISFKRSNSILLIRRGCVTGNTLHLANNSFFSLYAEIGFPSRHLFDNVDGMCLGKIAIQLLVLILLNVFAWILYYNGRRGSWYVVILLSIDNLVWTLILISHCVRARPMLLSGHCRIFGSVLWQKCCLSRSEWNLVNLRLRDKTQSLQVYAPLIVMLWWWWVGHFILLLRCIWSWIFNETFILLILLKWVRLILLKTKDKVVILDEIDLILVTFFNL